MTEEPKELIVMEVGGEEYNNAANTVVEALHSYGMPCNPKTLMAILGVAVAHLKYEGVSEEDILRMVNQLYAIAKDGVPVKSN